MCFNNQVYYDCIEKHLKISRGRLCDAPYQCGSWRRHDPDRLRRLVVTEMCAPELCPKCHGPSGGDDDDADADADDGDKNAEVDPATREIDLLFTRHLNRHIIK